MTLPSALDPDLLRSFVLIAEGRSFTDAAALVGRTQSAVSMQVKRLEELLGQPLLHRGKGGAAELTPHGRYLLEQARQILTLNDTVMATFRAPPLSGTIRLGTPDDYALAYLPAILKRFAETHPAVQVDVRCSPSGELQRSLKAGELDLTLLSDGHQPPDWPVVELWRGPLVWVTSLRFAPHRQDPLPLALAAGHGCDWADAAIHALEQAGRRYRDRLYLGLADRYPRPCPGGAGRDRLDAVLAARGPPPRPPRGRPAEARRISHPDAAGEAAAPAADRRPGSAYPPGLPRRVANGAGGGIANTRCRTGQSPGRQRIACRRPERPESDCPTNDVLQPSEENRDPGRSACSARCCASPTCCPIRRAWLPWRTVHLGLDLRGGSYLLMQVDMGAVIKERLGGLLDGVRQALRPHEIFYRTLEAQADQNRILLVLRNPDQTNGALAALKPLIEPEGPTNTPDLDIASPAPGTISLTLSPVALNERAQSAVQQSIEIVRRRIDETGVVDPQITQQGDDRIVVQLPGIGDPDRIKQLLGKTAHMTFQLGGRDRQSRFRRPTADRRRVPADAGQPRPEDRRPPRVDVDGGDLTDARAGTNPADRRMGGELHLQLRGRPADSPTSRGRTSTAASPSCWTAR